MKAPENYTEINARTIDRWAEEGIVWSVPLTHEAYRQATRGEWEVYLTPCRPVPRDWFPPLSGAQVLGLASGGGQQMPVFASQGAEVTVFDYSDRQLESERMVAAREGYDIRIVKGDMTRPLPFRDAEFDMIFHPVSNCYIEEVYPVWRECFRILKPGGLLLAGMDNGLNFLFNDFEALVVENKLPFNPLKNPEQYELLMKDDDAIQFSHTMEEQVGGQLMAGFRLTHLLEDTDYPDERGRLHEYAPGYVLTRAVRP
ncbi:MAG: class I SAM-dependent methyltransferase [Clostridiales bacterium]|nr:class I SAM-dependent methyltransferase [Clostridiales bacterium]